MGDYAPLRGLRVVEIGHYIAGPFCGQLLADQGAEVIKVESPSAMQGRFEHYFPMQNRNKRSVVLDLKNEQDAARLREIAEVSDVLLTNLAAGVPERLGFGYEALSQLNPGLIYVHVSGFGLDGPDAHLPAYDGVIQALSGLLHLTGEETSPPSLNGVFVADYVSGLYATVATLLCLREREQTGRGRLIDLSMLDCALTLLGPGFSEVLERRESPMRSGGRVRKSYAGVYPANDGFVYLAPLTVPMWSALAGVVGRDELLDFIPPRSPDGDRRLHHRDALDAILDEWTKVHTSRDIVARMRAAKVPVGEVLNVEQVIDAPQVRHRDMVKRLPVAGGGHVHVAGSPIPAVAGAFALGPPTAGEHTEEVLAEVSELRAGCVR